MNKANFKKKVYRKLDSSPLSESISLSSMPPHGEPKKIIPSTSTKGLREDFKKVFLPLMIDIFVLRQALENHKTQLQSTNPIQTEEVSKSPKEILERLVQLQGDIVESQHWCDGLILQIAKGIEEAKEVAALVNGEKKGGLLRKLLRRIKK